MPSRTIAIFDALVSALTGLSTTGANVKKSRVYNLPDGITSALSVRAGGETILEWNTAKVSKSREFKIVLHVAAKETEVDEILLQIEAEIWAALQTNWTLGLDYVVDTEFALSAEIEHQPGAQTTARIEQTWTVQYTHATNSMES